MNVKINGEYYIEIDNDQYILHQVKPQLKDPSKTSDKQIGFYTSLEKLIKVVIRRKMAEREETVTLDEFLALWKKYMESLSGS
jgi:hypothetical protein